MTNIPRQALLKLDFIIIGGGLAGLAASIALASCGHRVHVFEKTASGVSVSDTGVRVPSNGARVLLQWGLSKQMSECAPEIPSLDFVDMESGECVGYLGWAKEIMEELGAPPVTFSHRDLYAILRNTAAAAGVQITMNAHVTSISPPHSSTFPSVGTSWSQFDRPSLALATGEIFHADVLIGADGNHGIVRHVVEDVHCEEPETSLVVYTGCVSSESMLDDLHLREVIEMRHLFWMGDGVMMLSYPVMNDEAWTVLVWKDEEIDENAPDGWDTSIPPHSVVQGYALEPRLSAMIDRVPSFARVKSHAKPHAESWVDSSECILLIGEAAHPFTPCGLPGPSAALEDAATLGALFSHIRHPSQIASLLYAFEEIRQPRVQAAHNLELANLSILRLPPGPNRDTRNAVWTSAKKAALKQSEVMSRPDADPNDRQLKEQWQELFEFWGYDARDAAEDWWLTWGALEERALGMAQTDSGLHRGFEEFGVQRVETVVDS